MVMCKFVTESGVGLKGQLIMINYAVVGIGNFGARHLEAARNIASAGLANFVAVADIRLSAFPDIVKELRGQGVSCYENHVEMIAAHPELDLVTLPLPIQLHAKMAIDCMERGLNVLVEKPPAPTLAEARQIAEAVQRTGKLCGVSFQLNSSLLLRTMCNIVAAGKLGTVQSLSSLNLTQRYDSYYARTPWAGKIRANGAIVRDGTLNNPFAHNAQFLFTVAQAAAGALVQPVELEAELFAGHDIETEDTTSIRARLSSGAMLNFYSSVCTAENNLQRMRIEGTKGVINWDNANDPQAQVEYSDGMVETLPNVVPNLASNDTVSHGGTTEAMFRNFIEVLEGKSSRLACPIEDTLAFAEFVEKTFEGEKITHLHDTPYAIRVEVEANGQQQIATYLQDAAAYLKEAYTTGKLLSEIGAPWAK